MKVTALLTRILPAGKFSRAVGVLVGGTAGAQFVMVLAAPILTRFYSPDEFGVLAVYAALLTIFSVIVNLRYQLAIPLPNSDDEAASLLGLSVLCTAIVSIVTAILIGIFNVEIAKALDTPLLEKYIWLLPIGLFFSGIYQAFNYWSIRKKNFSLIATTRVKQAISMIAIQSLGYSFGALSLIIGQIGNHGFGSTALARYAFNSKKLNNLSFSGMISAARRYKKFPIYSTWAGLFNTIGGQLPPLMFAAIFSPIAAGLYSLAHRVLATPMTVIGVAIGNVFLSRVTQASRDGTLGRLILNIYTKLSSLAIYPTLIIIYLGPTLFEIIFGKEWHDAGELARWMAPWLYLVFITSPLSVLFEALEKQRQHLLFQTILVIVRIGAILSGCLTKDLFLTIIIFSLTSAGCWLGFLCWMVGTINLAATRLVVPSVKVLARGIVYTSPLLILQISEFSITAQAALIGISVALITLQYIKLLRSVYRNQ